MTNQPEAVKVTISDPVTGAVLEERICKNDYCMITAGNRYVDGVQVMGKPGRATHIITVKVATHTTSQRADSDG